MRALFWLMLLGLLPGQGGCTGADGSRGQSVIPEAGTSASQDRGRDVAVQAGGDGALDLVSSQPSAPDQGSVSPALGDLSQQVLATWGSSVCAGWGASGLGWAQQLERLLRTIKGPQVRHHSTPGHRTDDKESEQERQRVVGADFVLVCLSLGNEGLERRASDARAQQTVDSYLDDLFTDQDPNDGDPVSIVNTIRKLGARPIVTLAYPKGNFNSLHCRQLVEANIVQQQLGVPTINLLGATNAGNGFDRYDCQWADGTKAPVDAEADQAHPNQTGHDENFYAFPPDLLFALAAGKPFPGRPQGDYGYPVTAARPVSMRYTPQFAMHNYTLQFKFQSAAIGTIAAVELVAHGTLTLEIKSGGLYLVDGEGQAIARTFSSVTDGRWHDLALSYSYVRQRITLYLDGELVGEADARQGEQVRQLFPAAFVIGGPAASGRAAAPPLVTYKDLLINRAALHAREIQQRATSDWLGAGSLDLYAPLEATAPGKNRAQTLQTLIIR